MNFLISLALLFALSSCGIKGKPLPPLPEEPAVTDEKTDITSATVKPLQTLPVKKKKK